jgi:uncharacterized membrane protein (UPF0136 family)
MIRNFLIGLEIVLTLAAVAGEVYTILRGRQTLAGGGPLTGDRLRVLLDIVILDVIAILMAVSAYLVYAGYSWGRWVSLVAGLALVGAVSARPDLGAIRSWVPPVLSMLGIAVVALAILVPYSG